MTGETNRQLAQSLARLAVQTQSRHNGSDTRTAITEVAAQLVPGARWAGISLIEGNLVRAEAPTDPVVAKLDDLQNELGNGPCISAIRHHQTVHIEDMTTETRWPEFAKSATDLGVRSLLAFQLFVASETFGALNLYATEAHSFDEDSTEIGLIVAQHAAVALSRAASLGQFKSALASRDTIGQAKGMLMERYGIDAVQAFELLRKLSSVENTPLRDVAQQLVDHRERPPGIPAPAQPK